MRLGGIRVSVALLVTLAGLSVSSGALARENRLASHPPADGSVPDCLTPEGKPLPVDNGRVLEFKRTTRNQFLDRGFVEGTVVQNFEQRRSHTHFEIQIGSDKADVVEVIFNRDFGNPDPAVGDQAMVCGDYITSNARAGRYEASPSGAILHWVHQNSRGGPHPDGFVILRRKELFGYGQKSYPIKANVKVAK